MIRISRDSTPQQLDFNINTNLSLMAVQSVIDQYVALSLAEVDCVFETILRPFEREHDYLFNKAIVSKFHSKCAFCETKIGASGSLPWVNLRPYFDADDKTKIGYFWLRCQWSNYYSACSKCRSTYLAYTGKNGVPISGERAKPGTYGIENLLREELLIIDPCYDDPEDYFEYLFEADDNRLIGKILPKNNNEKAKKTIEGFKLNRAVLRKARRQTLETFKGFLLNEASDLFYSESQDQLKNQLFHRLGRQSKYAGIKRAYCSKLNQLPLALDVANFIQRTVYELKVQEVSPWHIELYEAVYKNDDLKDGEILAPAKLDRIEISTVKTVDSQAKQERRYNLAAIQKLIINHFTISELKQLAFQMEIDIENLIGEGQTKIDQVRCLVSYMHRCQEIELLLNTLREERPKIDWEPK